MTTPPILPQPWKLGLFQNIVNFNFGGPVVVILSGNFVGGNEIYSNSGGAIWKHTTLSVGYGNFSLPGKNATYDVKSRYFFNQIGLGRSSTMVRSKDGVAWNVAGGWTLTSAFGIEPGGYVDGPRIVSYNSTGLIKIGDHAWSTNGGSSWTTGTAPGDLASGLFYPQVKFSLHGVSYVTNGYALQRVDDGDLINLTVPGHSGPDGGIIYSIYGGGKIAAVIEVGVENAPTYCLLALSKDNVSWVVSVLPGVTSNNVAPPIVFANGVYIYASQASPNDTVQIWQSSDGAKWKLAVQTASTGTQTTPGVPARTLIKASLIGPQIYNSLLLNLDETIYGGDASLPFGWVFTPGVGGGAATMYIPDGDASGTGPYTYIVDPVGTVDLPAIPPQYDDAQPPLVGVYASITPTP